MKTRLRMWVAMASLYLVAFTVLVSYDIRHELIEATQGRRQLLEGAAAAIASVFPGDYEPLPGEAVPSEQVRQERARRLIDTLQPVAVRLAEAYSGMTVLVHVRDIDTVVAQGSPGGRAGMLGLKLRPEDRTPEVYERGELHTKTLSMPAGRVLAVFRPIYSGSRVVAYASASFVQGNIIAELKEAVFSRAAYFVVAAFAGTLASALMWFILRTDLERVKGSLRKKDALGVKGGFFLREFCDLVETAHPLVQDREFILRILDHLRPGVVVCDLNFKATFVNDSFLRLFGFTRKELLGKPLGILAEREDSGAPQLEKAREAIASGRRLLSAPSDAQERATDPGGDPHLSHS